MTLSRLLAPFTPFLSEQLFRNLVLALPEDQREASVHFTELPRADESLRSLEVEEHFERMRRVVEVGRSVREKRKVGLKMPLAKMTIIHRDQSFIESLKPLEPYIAEQLNVMEIEYSTNPSALKFSALPNSNKLGKALGKQFAAVAKAVRSLDSAVLQNFAEAAARDPTHTLVVEGVPLGAEDLLISIDAASNDNPHLATASDNVVALTMDFTPNEELLARAAVRECVNAVQKIRKASGLVPEDNVRVLFTSEDLATVAMLESQKEYANKILRAPAHFTTSANHDGVRASMEAEGYKVVAPNTDIETFRLVDEKRVDLVILKKD